MQGQRDGEGQKGRLQIMSSHVACARESISRGNFSKPVSCKIILIDFPSREIYSQCLLQAKPHLGKVPLKTKAVQHQPRRAKALRGPRPPRPRRPGPTSPWKKTRQKFRSLSPAWLRQRPQCFHQAFPNCQVILTSPRLPSRNLNLTVPKIRRRHRDLSQLHRLKKCRPKTRNRQ